MSWCGGAGIRNTPKREAIMSRHNELCFVIADGGHVRFVRPAADYDLRTVEAIDSTSVHRKTHELVSDRPGRAFESAAFARHAYSPRIDPHLKEKQRFAHLVAERINADAASGRFNELVVVAPTDILDEVTDDLASAARAALRGTLAKDLVKVPDHLLWPHLREWVRPVHRA
jgi:protein required for attachment to host cells